MKNLNFIAVDFETATASRMICQIGIAVVENGKITEKKSYLVQPPYNQYERFPMNVHSVKASDTMFEPTLDALWPEISHYFENKTLVAHNKSFDENALRKNLAYYKIDSSKVREFLCTYDMHNRASLSDCCKSYGILLESHHDALCDAVACAEIMIKCRTEGVKNIKKTTKKQKSFSFERIESNLLSPDFSKANEDSPFYRKSVVITGNFNTISRNDMAKRLRDLGADINSTISRKTNFVIKGEDAGPMKLKVLQKWLDSGYPIKVLTEYELIDILNGSAVNLGLHREYGKNLNITQSLIDRHLFIADSETINLFSRKQIYAGDKLSGNKFIFFQLFGNLGAFVETTIDISIDACIISDNTYANLCDGEKDDTIKYIEHEYNSSRSIQFKFKFLTESQFLLYYKKRMDKINDEVAIHCYEQYINSY
jgi:DNA polymerase-3 subunit epsilon